MDKKDIQIMQKLWKGREKCHFQINLYIYTERESL